MQCSSAWECPGSLHKWEMCKESETLDGKLAKRCELDVRHLCHFLISSWCFHWHSVWWFGFHSLELVEIRMCWQLFQDHPNYWAVSSSQGVGGWRLCGLLGKHSCICAGAVGKHRESESGFLSCWKSWALTMSWLQQDWWAESLNCFPVANTDWHFCVCFWKKHKKNPIKKKAPKKPQENQTKNTSTKTSQVSV